MSTGHTIVPITAATEYSYVQRDVITEVIVNSSRVGHTDITIDITIIAAADSVSDSVQVGVVDSRFS